MPDEHTPQQPSSPSQFIPVVAKQNNSIFNTFDTSKKVIPSQNQLSIAPEEFTRLSSNDHIKVVKFGNTRETFKRRGSKSVENVFNPDTISNSALKIIHMHNQLVSSRKTDSSCSSIDHVDKYLSDKNSLQFSFQPLTNRDSEFLEL